MINKGDILTAKINLTIDLPIFYKDKTYEVLDFVSKTINNVTKEYMHVSSEDGIAIMYMELKDAFYDDDYVWNCFYTPTELRKHKMKTII